MNNKDFENLSENEKDPKLRFDALTGGVDAGGLRSVSSIYLLICYIVKNIDGNVTGDIIINAMSESGIANYFEVADAVAKLKEAGTLIENKDGALKLANSKGDEIELIEKDLPYTLRERSIHLVQKIIAKEKYRRENVAKVVKDEDGYKVILNIADNKTEFMNLKLFAPTAQQAEMIKEKFLSNPAKVYESVISAIFSNKE